MRKAFFQALILCLLLSLSWVVFVVRCQREQTDDGNGEVARPVLTPVDSEERPAPYEASAKEVGMNVEAVAAGFFADHPLARELAEWEAWFRTRPSADEAQAALAELRDWLDRLAAVEALSLLLGYLESGRDVSTGLGFRVGPGGGLRSSPSLRTFLLDELGRRYPEAAAILARTGLLEMRSADEHALHLRNFVWGEGHKDAGGDAFLRDRTRALVKHEAWRAAPTAGFAEAFDTVVFLGLVDLAPLLARSTDRSSPPHLRQASYLSLDRLVIQGASDVLPYLLDDLEGMDGQPFTRAGFFARANPAVGSERSALEGYLLSGAILPEEGPYFFELFPNLNLHISDNLLTGRPDLSHEVAVERIRSARSLMREWQSDQRFLQWVPLLEAAEMRLGKMLGEGIAQP
ncbi:MAG: hypothetical protein JJT96_11760 [Opitutales bacterium]|nr:hypothetical protein [Opitutales bacterium]